VSGAGDAGVAESDTTVLGAAALTKRFGERVAVDAVSLQVHAGELVALIGPNGAGKTTLLSLLAGVLKADGGGVSGGDRTPVGWVPQQPAVYSKLTVAENLALWARLEHVADQQATVARMLEQTDLTERADEQVSRLSGGNRQRVNIAVGMLSAPAVLLLDEPSAALDPIQRGRLWQFIRGLSAQGTSVIFSTHNVSEAERYAARVLVLREGELIFDGPPRALASDGIDFEEAFVDFLRAHGGEQDKPLGEHGGVDGDGLGRSVA
jgi:ABC-2 type transport system ATP-binding protein